MPLHMLSADVVKSNCSYGVLPKPEHFYFQQQQVYLNNSSLLQARIVS